MLDIVTSDLDTHVVLRPVGELDAFTVPSFREVLTALTGTARLLIDLSDVPFMDSAGLGALIGGIRRLRESGGEVAVACGRPAVARLLHTTGFDRIVVVAATVAAAQDALLSGSGPAAS